jgi:hypothetical protein
MRAVLLASAMAMTISPVLAETVKCTDAKGEVAVEYDIDYEPDPNAVTRVQMQIAGDFGISTDPAHEDYSGEDIAEQVVDRGLVDVTLRVKGEGGPALRLRVVEASEGQASVTAGVLAVSGGGVWAITCTEPGV